MRPRFYKHFTAEVDLAVEFNVPQRLAAGETLASNVAVTVLDASSGAPDDLSITAETIQNGTQIAFRAGGGTADRPVQPGRWETHYCLELKATTSTGRVESEAVDLVVYDCVQRAPQ